MAEQKTIVVTGVSKGLGRAMVDGFVAQGHRVAGCARSGEAINELAETYPSEHFAAVDTTSNDSVAAWAAQVIDTVGPPDLLLNNAATINPNAELWTVEPDEFARVMDVNINGVFYCIRHFVPAMVERGEGVIVNFSSGWGRSTSPEVGPYCATKWAIEGLSQSLAQELPRGMASIPLNPGIIDTELLQSCFGGSASSYPSPAQWAQRAVPFLLSLSGRHNGQSLTVS